MHGDLSFILCNGSHYCVVLTAQARLSDRSYMDMDIRLSSFSVILRTNSTNGLICTVKPTPNEACHQLPASIVIDHFQNWLYERDGRFPELVDLDTGLTHPKYKWLNRLWVLSCTMSHFLTTPYIQASTPQRKIND